MMGSALRYREVGGTHDGRKLKVISYQDKSVRHPQRSDAGGQSDLGGFIDDAIVEFAPGKDGTEAKSVRQQ